MILTENTWCVYKHISPSNKVYIGITHHKDPSKRWGKNGIYYRKGTAFYNAIKKYGWDEIRHEIITENCSERIAKKLEILFISYYKALNKCYNLTIGGDGHNQGKDCTSTKYRTKQSRLYRENHPEYDKEQYIKHKENKKNNAREYYKRNRDKILEYKKNNINKEKARLRAAKWRKEHPNYMKEYMKIYNSKNKENGKDFSFG